MRLVILPFLWGGEFVVRWLIIIIIIIIIALL